MTEMRVVKGGWTGLGFGKDLVGPALHSYGIRVNALLVPVLYIRYHYLTVTFYM